jgi:hypothetical protein
MEKNNFNNFPIDPRWIDQINKNWGNYCSSCGAVKDNSKLKFIKKLGIAHQYVSECENCGLKTMLNIIPNLGMQVTQLRNDISPNEFKKLSEPVTNSDYLDFYSGMKNLNNADDLIGYLSKVKS